jgi:hypothetical protein
MASYSLLVTVYTDDYYAQSTSEFDTMAQAMAAGADIALAELESCDDGYVARATLTCRNGWQSTSCDITALLRCIVADIAIHGGAR